VPEAVHAFLLGFPALFSIVNPISGALIFRGITASRSHEARAALARLVALNSLGVMMGALWAGSYVLAFFGISLAALRVAGGLVVALSGWRLLNAPEKREGMDPEQTASAEGMEDIALFPLTIPLTTGPGTISVAVALGAGHPKLFSGLGWFFLGMTAAAAAMAVTIWVTYHYADRLTQMMGPTGTRTITRISAFLLLCIGVQILITGIEDVLGPLLATRP
jgi:multiple antibiotic resistance protein